MRKFRFFGSLVLLFFCSCAFGGVGTEIFDFLNLPNGAKHAGIGGCSMGMIGDPFALFANPAGLRTEAKKLGFTYTNYIAGIQDGCGTYVLPEVWGGVFGAGISYLNSGEIPLTDENGVEKGTYSSHCFVPVIGYARDFGNSRVGLSGKIIYQTIDEYAGLAVAGGIGYLFYPKEWEGLVIGGTVQNFGMKLKKFDETYENLPIFARLGLGYPLFNKLVQMAAEINLPERDFIFGVEWMPNKLLSIRVGYYSWGRDLEVGKDLDIFAGKSFGLGFRTEKFVVDYALTPKVDLGLVNRISITYLFPQKKREMEKIEDEEIYFKEFPSE